MLDMAWRHMKVSRSLPLGPVALFFRFTRRVRVSSNWRRRWSNWRRGAAAPPIDAIDPAERRPNPLLPDALVQGVQTALLVGVGPGLGDAMARTLAAAGMRVALASRNAERLDALVASLQPGAAQALRAYGCDATDERSIQALMRRVEQDLGVPHLVVYGIQAFGPGATIDIEVDAFEACWRQNCLGGFIVAREAARAMRPLQRGSIVLVGSTSGLLGRARHLNLAVGKFGLRALAQVMSRELWPEGIHVAHCVVDADIRTGDQVEPYPQALPGDIAALILNLHRQPRSCWTSELDVRPAQEQFWEHC